VLIKDHIILAPMASFGLYLPLVGFLWGPINLVALELLCRTVPLCFEVVYWRENEAAKDDSRARHRWEPRLHPGSRDLIST
jgi:hypothetical protein